MVLWLCACVGVERHEAHGQHRVGNWSVLWFGVDAELDTVVTPILEEVDRAISNFREDSEVSRASRLGGAELSPLAAAAVARALGLAEETHGAFDPTVGPLMALWGFRDETIWVQPSEAAITSAMARVGWKRVRLEGHFLDPGPTRLDLSAVGQGFAADLVSDGLVAAGLSVHLVEVDGEIRVRGTPPGGLWQVQIDSPRPEKGLGMATLGLRSGGLATSGNYRKRRNVAGVEVTHILDPRTGRPAITGVASATVVAPTATEADGLATVCVLLGQSCFPVILAHGAEAWLVFDDGEEVATVGFPVRQEVDPG